MKVKQLFWLWVLKIALRSRREEGGFSMMTDAIVGFLLIADIIAMALFALIYLRQRKMSRLAFLGWGLLAVSVPVIGPFIVISNRPGEWDPSFSVKKEFSRLVTFLRRILPEPPRAELRVTRAHSRRQLR